MQKEEYTALKQAILKKEFAHLNPQQQEAVFRVKAPTLILAGAGSGKTTVIVNRIAYLLQYGNAFYDETPKEINAEDLSFLKAVLEGKQEDKKRLRALLAVDPPKPWHVLAITFTNKAAGELKDRLHGMLGGGADFIHAGTFHAECVRILRKYISVLGYSSRFSIYDTGDSKRLIKNAMQQLNISEKMFPPKNILGEISRAKDQMISFEEYRRQNEGNYPKEQISKIYELYQKQLKVSDALDFDDIICLTVLLLQNYPDILEKCQQEFRYILVDEYQDTNQAQYQLIRLLSQKEQKLCVVGDDDQSIYRFRGATIENILQFEKQFPHAKTIRLEQNYRSTQHILNTANQIIQNNQGRKGKNLWTDKGDGLPVSVCLIPDEEAEASYIGEHILDHVKNKGHYNDIAVLYRMNAQSAALERYFIRAGIPYRIVGGTRFYDRREIRDILAYLYLINNDQDDLRLERIINQPKRCIGQSTVQKLKIHAQEENISLFSAMKAASSYPDLSSKEAALLSFVSMIESLRNVPLPELISAILQKTGYADMLKEMGTPGEADMENILELSGTFTQFLQQHEEAGLSDFLEEISLYTDLDDYQKEEDAAVLMTLHAAKGLEFPIVFLSGLEDGILPSQQALSTSADIEEERRLMYVGVTRAKEKLYLLHAKKRMIFGEKRSSYPSRFLSELPNEGCEYEDHTKIALTFENPKKQTTWSFTEGPSKKKEPVEINYQEGDRIVHTVFGEGTVLSMTKMGDDFLVEVDFDKKGRKKIMAQFARLQKL